MPTYKKNDIDKILKAINQGKVVNIYLVVGDSFLCRQAAERLLKAMLPDKSKRSLVLSEIDGEKEDLHNTLNLLKTYSLIGGRKIIKVNDSKLFHSKAVAKSLWDRAQKAYENNDSKRAAMYISQMAETGGQSINDLTEISAAKWKSAFGFSKPQNKAKWLKEFLGTLNGLETIGTKPDKGGAADLFCAAFEAGIPEDNILVLQAETVDKRKKLYKFIQEHGVVLDLSVASGSSKAARADQENVLKELVSQTLASFGKTIEARAIPVLFERVGFHPVAIVREVEKLALYVGEGKAITMDDMEVMIGRTREDALYELTEAFSDQNLGQALLIANRLCENGVHPLVLVSGLRNIIKKLLLVCSFKAYSPPTYVEGMNYAVFQKGYLPELREAKSEWVGQLPSHPYAIYMLFSKTKKHSIKRLASSMEHLLLAEFRLKSSAISPIIIFENFLWQAIA